MAFPDGWSGYFEIECDYTKTPEAPGVLYVALSEAPAGFWAAMDDSSDTTGATIRVSDESNTLIPSYVASINTSTNTGALFVLGTGISTVANTTYRVWVGGSASTPAATDPEGRNATFAAYEGFYLPGVTLTDLTGNGRDLTAVNSPGTDTSGYEGITAATYNGSNQYHKYEGTQAVTNWPMTMESLAYSTTITATQTVMALTDSSSASNSLNRLQLAGAVAGDPFRVRFMGATGSAGEASSTASYSAMTWYYQSATRDANSGTTRLYVNGAADGTNATTITAPSVDRLGIAAQITTAVSVFLNGRVAAAYLSDSERSANYVTAMNNSWTLNTYTAGAWTDTTDSTGWFVFQTAANVSVGDTAWSNVNNALDDDADYASVSLSLEDASDYLTLTNPSGISIPGGATISAVHFRIKRHAPGGDIQDYDIRAVKGGTRVGNNLADSVTEWTASDVTVDYGGTLLGTSWIDTDFGSNFGIAIQVLDKDAHSDSARVITVWGKVDWSTGGPTGTSSITTGAIDVDGVGTLDIGADGDVDIAPVTVLGTGTLRLTGTGSVTTEPVEVDGAGTLAISATSSVSTGPVAVDGDGTLALIGTANIVLGPIDVDSTDNWSDSGWVLFGSASQTEPGVEWTTLGNVLTSDPDAAEVSDMEDEQYSRLVKVTSPNIPLLTSGAEIISIQFRLDISLESGGSQVTSLNSVRPVKGGSVVGDEVAGTAVITSPTIHTFADGLHGTTWTGADVLSGGWSFDVFNEGNPGTFGGADAKTAWVRVIYLQSNVVDGTADIVLGPIEIDANGFVGHYGTVNITLGAVDVLASGFNDFCVCCIGYTMANLLEVRKRVARESGHHELVANYAGGDYADNGMDDYIRAAARFLDDKFQYDKSEAWFYKKLTSGQSEVTFRNNRIIKEVWINSSGGNRTKLKRLTLNEMREEYVKDTLAGETTGVPKYWVPAILGLAPEQLDEDEASFLAEGLTDYDLIMFGDHYPHKGIYVMPPTDDTITVEVLAEWYSLELCDDEDVSFWSQHPEILAMATRREIEIHLHRNTTGAQDFERPIMDRLNDLYKNLIAEEVSGPPEDFVRRG